MRRRVAASGVIAALAGIMLTVAAPAPAHAYWHSAGRGVGIAETGTLAPPTQVLASTDGPATSSVTWTASEGVLIPEGYYVQRVGAEGVWAACGTGPAVLQSTSTCSDNSLPTGEYAYRVVAVYKSWTATSSNSAPVTIVASLLGAAAPFSILGTAVTTTGFTKVSGDLGVTPGAAVAGFPDGIVAGEIHAGDAAAAAAQLDLIDAYDHLAARTASVQIAGDLIGLTFGPGVYHAGAALALTGALTLDGGGDPNATFIFQADAALDSAASSSIVLINGARAANIYWVVDAAVGTGANSAFAGNILAHGAITLGAGAHLIGRAHSLGAVTMADNIVRFTQELPPTITIAGGTMRVTKDSTPTMAGTTTALAGRTVIVTFAGETLASAVQPDQSWAVTATSLIAGSYIVAARVKDAAGNGAMATQTLVVELNPATVDLGAAEPFSILGGISVVATGDSYAEGDVGVSPGASITGLPSTAIGGTTHAGDFTAADALAAVITAIDDASTRPAHTGFAGDTIGDTFLAGVHHTIEAFALSGTMTLDGEGDPNAVFIFQIGAAMNTAANTSVLLVGAARAANVFWVVDGAVTTGALATLPGTILATGAITLGEGTRLTGRALALGGIDIAASTITRPTL